MDKRTVITAPGIYQDVSIDDYHADKSWISSTGLKHAKRSLAEFRMWSDGHFDAERKAVFDFGNAFELALLDHDGFDQDVAIMPTEDWEREALEEKPDLKRPKQSTAYQSRKSAWETDHAGKYWIPDTGPESFDTIRYMLESCYRDSLIQKLIKNIEYQNSLTSLGPWCHRWPDALPRGFPMQICFLVVPP